MRLLYIAHRIPYPPNKGDKIRSYNEVLFLSKRFDVDLVCFLEDEGDRKHLQALQGLCRSATGFLRGPLLKAARLLGGFLRGRPLSVALYDHSGMRRKIQRLIREHGYERIVVFSGQMAQYIPADQLPRTAIDFCDVDSHKWDNYADRMPFYASWFYRLEARRLQVAGAAEMVRWRYDFRRHRPGLQPDYAATVGFCDGGPGREGHGIPPAFGEEYPGQR